MSRVNIEYRAGRAWQPLMKSSPTLIGAVEVVGWHWSRGYPKVRYFKADAPGVFLSPPEGLTPGVAKALRQMSERPAPYSTFNPGVVTILLRHKWATEVSRPSPFDSHKGKPIPHLTITGDGRKMLHTQT